MGWNENRNGRQSGNRYGQRDNRNTRQNETAYGKANEVKYVKLDENNYVDQAEAVIKTLTGKTDRNGRPIPPVTTSKLRNLLAMTADIQNEVMNSKAEKLSRDLIERINYLKLRFVYEAGRDKDVKALVEEGKILEHLAEIKNNKQQYILFSRYMEALVAYRKYYGGRDE